MVDRFYEAARIGRPSFRGVRSGRPIICNNSDNQNQTAQLENMTSSNCNAGFPTFKIHPRAKPSNNPTAEPSKMSRSTRVLAQKRAFLLKIQSLSRNQNDVQECTHTFSTHWTVSPCRKSRSGHRRAQSVKFPRKDDFEKV